MRLQRLCHALVLLGVVWSSIAAYSAPPQNPYAPRTWKDATGSRQAVAAFLGFAGDNVRLRRTDGIEVVVPIDKLGLDDQSFLRRCPLDEGATPDTWRILFDVYGHGLLGEYFTDGSFDQLGLARVDAQVDFKYGRNQNPYTGGKEIQPRDGWYEHFTVRWTGQIVPRFSETYTFSVVADDGFHLWIDGQLIASNWHWKGNHAYTGEIKLTAGRPAAIRLLFRQGPFGGQVSLSWSSPSQPHEIIPQSQLFLPVYETDDLPTGGAPPESLAGHVGSLQVPLIAPIATKPRGGWNVRQPLVLKPAPGGGYKLGWNDKSGATHLTTLDTNFTPRGRDTLLARFDLRDLAVDADGSLAILGAELPMRMWIRRIDPSGQQTFITLLTGEKGKVLGAKFLDNLWCFSGRLASSGTQYAVNFGQAFQTDPNVAHQGGHFGIYDLSGQKVQEDRWTVSHSHDQQVIFHNGSFLTLALGDAFPKGLRFDNRTLRFGRTLFPAENELEKWPAGQARLGSMFSVGRRVAIVFLSGVGDSRELFYILANDDGHVVRTAQLTDSPLVDEQTVKAALFGRNILVVWREGKSDTKAGVIDLAGRWLVGPEPLGQPIPQNHELTRLPGGDVAWMVADDGDRLATLVLVTQAAGGQVDVVAAPPPTPIQETSLPQAAPVTESAAASSSSEPEKQTLELVNRERTKAGLPPFKEQSQLARAAREHSTNMARQGKMDHTLDGKAFSQRIIETGYRSMAAGENIASWAPTPAEAVNMWMHSPGHRANILSSTFREIGVGIASGPSGKYYTLVFATPL